METQKDLTNAEKKELKKEAKEIQEERDKQNINGEKTKIVENLEREEKVKNYFDKIEFLSLTDEQKEEVGVSMKNNSKIDTLYIIEIILSCLIVTLGMLQNSVAVVVGAMLIAPILRPLNSLSYSIARGGQSIFKNSLIMIIVSVFTSVFLSFMITKIVGLENETTEILSRIHPNIIDFFIAIFSAIVGVMSIKFSRLGQGMSGVAMAVALLPPLSVIGIELAFGNFSSALGAFLLFLTNILAIGLVSTIFFWLYGFTPHEKSLQSKVFIRLVILLFTLFLIFIPLFLSFDTIKVGNKFSSLLMSNLKENNVENIEIDDIKILKNTNKEIDIIVTLNAGYGDDVKNVLEEQKEYLQKVLGKEVNIEFKIIGILKL